MIIGGLHLADPELQRFAFTPAISELCSSLADSEKTLTKLSKSVVLPAEDLWVEMPVAFLDSARVYNPEMNDSALFTGNSKPPANQRATIKKMGFAIFGVETEKDKPRIHEANVVVYIITATNDIGFCTAFKIHFESGRISWGTNPRVFVTKDIPILNAIVCCACAIINTPRIFESTSPEFEKLNKARIKRGLLPLMPYNEISMPRETAEAFKDAEFGNEREDTPEHRKGARKRHHVRTFVRITEGIVQLVRPHWRGDKALGYAKSVTTVRHGRERIGGQTKVITR